MYINVGIDIHIYNTFRIRILFIKQLKYQEAFKGTLLVIFLPFYTQKTYNRISRSTKENKRKRSNKIIEEDLFPV